MKHLESKIQQTCVHWFRLQYPQHVLFAVPNGGRRGKVEAAIMKGEGVLPGVADLYLAHPSKGCHGLFIEMKTEKGRQSNSQLLFEEKITERGYHYAVCRSLDEFMNTVNEYLK
jgi:hypothetical protein